MEPNHRRDLATRISNATGVDAAKVGEVVQLALEELHRISIVDEKGPTAAVMEACFSCGADAAFHLIGLYASEHAYHGRHDNAGAWAEVAMRFIPTAYRAGCDRIAPWFAEKTGPRLELNASIPQQMSALGEIDRLSRGNDHVVSRSAGVTDDRLEEADPLADQYAREHKEFLERHNPSVLSRQSDPRSYLSSVGNQAAEMFLHLMSQHLHDPELQKLPAPERARELQSRRHEIEEIIREEIIFQPRRD